MTNLPNLPNLWLSADAMDTRLAQLQAWCSQQKAVPVLVETLRVASADASFRRYFRVNTSENQTVIAMDAPPPHEDVQAFIQMADIFAQTQVHVPKILAKNVAQGFCLLTDFGEMNYLTAFMHAREIGDIQTIDQMVIAAIKTLLTLQNHSCSGILPRYDRHQFLAELQLFPQWYIERHCGYSLTPEETYQLQQIFEKILANNLAQASVFVHRDYHSRNLMVLANDPLTPGVIDFQDALYGPVTYDLVSLLRDAYIRWEDEQVLDWMTRYWKGAKDLGIPVPADIDTFYCDVDWMGFQRHLKILGIFSRLYYRDGKSQYLNDLPLVLQYVRQIARRYQELQFMLRLLDIAASS